MSYILDALKKAEAERHGGPRAAGPIPPSFHVHAQRQPLWRRPWVWSVLSAVAVVGAGLIWMGGAPSSAPQPPAQAAQDAPPAPAAPQAPAASSPPPVAQVPASPPPAAPAPAPAPAAPPAAAPTPPLAQAPVRTPEPAVEKPKTAERKPAERKAPEAAAKPAKRTQQEDTKAAAASTPSEKPQPAPEPPVGTLRDLPAQLQQEIPQYSVGGYIYSASKADRSVVINKRLLREGDEIAPGFKLETMTPTGMILSYKGYRYRASY